MSGSVELPLFHALKTCLHVQIAELLSAPKHQALQKQVVVIDGGVLEHLLHDPVGDRAVVLLGRFLVLLLLGSRFLRLEQESLQVLVGWNEVVVCASHQMINPC